MTDPNELREAEKKVCIDRMAYIEDVLNTSNEPLWDLLHEYRDHQERLKEIEHAEQQRLTSV